MTKRGLVVVALLGMAGAAYAYRAEIGPNLPPPLAGLLNGKPVGSEASTKAPGSGPVGGQAKGPSVKGGAAPVTVATATLADMPIVLSAPGTVEPLATVAVRPRVDGQVVEVGFREGDLVQAGSLLYRLDDRLVRAQIKQVEATITRDQASLKDAMSISERREALLRSKYASEASAETARQNVEVLRASIAANQALLDATKTQLDYLVIRAPISGRTGSMTARLGAFVRSADPAALVTINQTKPIAVAFALPQINLAAVKLALERKARATVRLPGSAGSPPRSVDGVLSFVDNQIDKTTGTITAKVTVENAEEVLWPGQAVNVDLTVETRTGIVSVPASAVLPAQQGMIVWVVGDGNRVAVRQVTLERVIGQTSFVTSGVQAGERVVTDGQLRLAPGMPITIRETPGAGAAAKEGGSPKGKQGTAKAGDGPAGVPANGAGGG